MEQARPTDPNEEELQLKLALQLSKQQVENDILRCGHFSSYLYISPCSNYPSCPLFFQLSFPHQFTLFPPITISPSFLLATLLHYILLSSLAILLHCISLSSLATLLHCISLSSLATLLHCISLSSLATLLHCISLSSLATLLHCISLSSLAALLCCIHVLCSLFEVSIFCTGREESLSSLSSLPVDRRRRKD